MKITDDHLYALLSFIDHGDLITLNLSHNLLTSNGSKPFFYALLYNRTIKRLDLSYNNFESASYISYALQYNTSLLELDLTKTNLGPNGCNELLDALLKNPYCKIFKLGLKLNDVGDEQIEKILNIAKKKVLCVVETYPPKEGEIKENGKEDGWLSYSGWQNFSLLKDQLKLNLIERRKTIQYIEDPTEEALSYLLYSISTIKDETIKTIEEFVPSPIKKFVHDTIHDTSDDHEHHQIQSWDSWKKVHKNQKDWENLTQKEVDIKEQNDEDEWILLDKKENKIEKVQPQKMNCGICLDETPIEDIYIMDECEHKFCKSCLCDYIKIKIKNGETDGILCPVLTCRREIQIREMTHLVSKEDMKKYEEFSLKKALSQMPNITYCPNILCNDAIQVIGNENHVMKCPSCKIIFCINCKVEYHEGMTCKEYEEWKVKSKESEKIYKEWASKNTRQCPNCKVDIIKNKGCNHIKCIHCGQDFCWLCNQKINLKAKEGHFGLGKCDQFFRE